MKQSGDLIRIFNELAAKQEPLGEEFDRAWSENVEELYEPKEGEMKKPTSGASLSRPTLKINPKPPQDKKDEREDVSSEKKKS